MMSALQKSQLRKEARAVRARLLRPDFAQSLAVFASDLPIASDAIVAGYQPIKDEADPRLLMRALSHQGHPLALPVLLNAGIDFRFWREGDRLVRNSYGIDEPSTDAQSVIPQVILVPLLAFDASGHRLGYGGGSYDRALGTLRAERDIVAVGVAYSGQEFAALPHEQHDHVLDGVLTERGFRPFTTHRE